MALKTGEYAIFNLQFRVGDGENITKDWQAMECLETFRIPYVLWDGTSDPSTFVSSLPLAQTPSLVPASEMESPTRSLSVRFDQPAVTEHYSEFIEHGEEAYIRSHFGDARLSMVRNTQSLLGMFLEQNGTMEVMLDHLRTMGMGDLADRIASFRGF